MPPEGRIACLQLHHRDHGIVLIYSIPPILAGIVIILMAMVLTLLVGLTIAQYADPNTYRSFPHKCHEWSLGAGPGWDSSSGVSLWPPGTYCIHYSIETGETVRIEPTRSMSTAFGASGGVGLVTLALVLWRARRHPTSRDDEHMQPEKMGTFVVWIGVAINTTLAVVWGLYDFSLHGTVMMSTSAALGLAAGIVARRGIGGGSLTIAATLSLLAALILVPSLVYAIPFLVAALLFTLGVAKSLRSSQPRPS